MPSASRLQRLGSSALGYLAARVLLSDSVALDSSAKRPSQSFRSRDGRRALWVSMEGADVAELRHQLGDTHLDELLWVDLRDGDEPVDLVSVAALVTRISGEDLQAAIDAEDAVAPWARDRAAPAALAPTEPLWAWMQADLIADQFVRLAASGGDNSRSTSLKRVFTDLPIERSEDDFCAWLLRLGGRIHLGLSSLEDAPRVLLVGGPGQGKTTLGQFVCQAHRASLLRTFGASLSDAAAPLVADLGDAADGVLCQRIPVFITLHKFADALESGQIDSVEAWVVAHANERLKRQLLTIELLDAWLSRWPSLVVFDGLDEVPPSANREPTLAAVRQFLARHSGADMITIASTRPQGYRGELNDWRAVQLADLTPDHVQIYGEKLYASWVAHDAARQAELLRRLVKATREPATAHLTRSPLQVLILATLVEQSGSPPRERWRLFREYFRIILDRERERQFKAVQVLRDHQDVIERLHAELGYRAQLAGELAGGTSDGLRRSDVAAVVRGLLEENHHDPATIEDVVTCIDDAVFDRLVFLSGEGDDRVRFDVRSLQEFFAAERIFLGPESLVPRHMEALAGSAHWRNVLLFVVGRLVVDRPHLIDRIDPLCDAVDGAEDGVGGVAGAGLRLALWLLNDGAVASKPRLVEALLARVLDRVDELDADDNGLLVGAQGDWPVSTLAPRLMEVGSAGTREIGWLCFELLRNAGEADRLERACRSREPWALAALRQSIQQGVRPDDLTFFSYARRGLPLGDVLFLEIVFAHQAKSEWLRVPQNFLPFRSINGFPETDDVGPCDPTWDILGPWQAFAAAPSPESLENLVAIAVERGALQTLQYWGPWPAAAIAALPPPERSHALEKLRRGDLGNERDWRAAEERWRTQRVSIVDRLESLASDLPFPGTIATKGSNGLEISPVFHVRARSLLARLPSQDVMGAIQQWERWWENNPTRFDRPEAQELAAYSQNFLHLRLDDRWATSETWTAHLAELASWTVHEAIEVYHGTKDTDASWLFPHTKERPWLLRWWLDVPPPPLAAYHDIPTTFDDDHLTWVAHLVRVPILTADEVPALAAWMKAHEDTSAWALPRFPDRLASIAPPGALPLLRAMLELGLGDPKHIRRAIRDILAARPTSLQTTSVARDHGLPLPVRPAKVTAGEDPLQPVHIASITVEHLRVWDAETISVAPTDPDRGSWLLFIGANGVGKTTLLRGLALCLLDPPTSDALLAQVPGTLVASGAEDARVKITFRDGTHANAQVRGDKVVPNGAPPDLFVVGYGPRRGTLLGVTRKDIRFQSAEAVVTLFVEGGNLIHATSWLKDLYTGKLEKPAEEDEQILDAVITALKQVLPGVTSIDVNKDGVTVRRRDGGPLPLEAMSDGYLTTAGWIIDLVARWVNRQRKRGRSITGDLLARMTGLVLIDEIDLHLHPKWQWEVVEALRTLFPRMSFIATTHNPITLLGANAGEVAVIDRGENGLSRAELRDIPRGTNAEELLTGPWFGLPSTVDRDTLRLLDEQRELLRTSRDAGRLAEVDAELAQRLRRPHAVGVEREAEAILAQERHRRLKDLTPEEREAHRRRAIEALRRVPRS